MGKQPISLPPQYTDLRHVLYTPCAVLTVIHFKGPYLALFYSIELHCTALPPTVLCYNMIL